MGWETWELNQFGVGVDTFSSWRSSKSRADDLNDASFEDVATFRAILSDHGNRERNCEENPLLKWWGALVEIIQAP